MYSNDMRMVSVESAPCCSCCGSAGHGKLAVRPGHCLKHRAQMSAWCMAYGASLHTSSFDKSCFRHEILLVVASLVGMIHIQKEFG